MSVCSGLGSWISNFPTSRLVDLLALWLAGVSLLLLGAWKRGGERGRSWLDASAG